MTTTEAQLQSTGDALPEGTQELAPPPEPTEASERTHRLFKQLNPWSTIPLLRAGLGPWLGTPAGGYLLLLRARPQEWAHAGDAAEVLHRRGFGLDLRRYRAVDPVVPHSGRRAA
jgi:hypothetical protein